MTTPPTDYFLNGAEKGRVAHREVDRTGRDSLQQRLLVRPLTHRDPLFQTISLHILLRTLNRLWVNVRRDELPLVEGVSQERVNARRARADVDSGHLGSVLGQNLQHFLDPIQIVDPSRKSRGEVSIEQVPFKPEILLQEDFGDGSTRSTQSLPLLGCIGFGPLVVHSSIGVLSDEWPYFRI